MIFEYVTYNTRTKVFYSKKRLKGSSINVMKNLTKKGIFQIKKVQKIQGFEVSGHWMAE